MKPRTGAAAWAWIAVGALAVRLIYLAELRDSPLFAVLIGDGQQYDAWAREIAGGQWIGTEVFYQTPLYPYLLAIIFKFAGHHLLVVRVIQSLLGAASCVLLAVAGARFFNRRVGIVAGALLAIYPPAIFFDGLIQKSSVDLFLMTLILALLGEFRIRPHWKWLVGAGAAVAALALNRENARILYPVIVAWLWGYFRPTPARNRVAWVAIFTAAIAALLLPVGIRNYRVGGEFLISTAQMGPNFYIGNHPGAQGSYEPLVEGHGSAADERVDATRLAEEAAGRKLSPGQVSDYWLGQAMDYIRESPWNWLRLMGRKALLTFNRAEATDTESIEVYSEYSRLLRALFWIHFGILLPLGVLGVWESRADWRRLVLLYGVFLGLALTVTLFYVLARYRFPMIPVLILFAACALSALPERIGDWRRTWVPGLLVAAGVAVASNLALKTGYDETYENLGSELIRQGRPVEAVPLLQKAIERAPDYAAPRYNLGLVFNQTGERQRAIASFADALRLRPTYFEAHSALALTLQEEGRAPEALEHFQEAARLKPASAEARSNLGFALANAGQRPQAISEYRESLRLNPDSATTHNSLAVALQQEGKIGEAIEQYGAALKLRPAYPEAHANLALALQASGSSGAAVEHFREALRLLPGNFGLHINFGNLLIELSRVSEAIEQYEEAVRLAPGIMEAHFQLAKAYANTGRLTEAVASLQKALDIARAEGHKEAGEQIEAAIRACQARMPKRAP